MVLFLKNHNRIHFGYHYPRSIDTAKQSILGLSSFAMEYNDCIISDFENYYCISNTNSNAIFKQGNVAMIGDLDLGTNKIV